MKVNIVVGTAIVSVSDVLTKFEIFRMAKAIVNSEVVSVSCRVVESTVVVVTDVVVEDVVTVKLVVVVARIIRQYTGCYKSFFRAMFFCNLLMSFVR